MNLLMQRAAERPKLPRVYAANTFFYPKLMQAGQAGLRRWTRKVDIFAHDLLVVPVHLGVHWCVSLVDFRARRVAYLDSMGGRNAACLQALMQYLRDEHQDKKGSPFDDAGWRTECLKDIPQQMNGSDCGMFACTFAEFTCRDAPYTFSQAHMPYLRRKAALEILQGKLLL
ncbi:sentrin-specific protease 1-like [Ostrinia furnacalis]|uniref:sentrin-specific protease 1-like n=1 Tax=Ostrinia furnacalis TaxID=93504 RepID=UPI0010403754|nr:sentrin-specific protease 1-like [Ostrinia furnacalis]